MDGRDRDDLEFDAEVLGQFFGVGDGMFRAEAAGHGDADDFFLSQGGDGEGGGDGRVDSAGEAQDDAGEAAFADVVAQAEDEGFVHRCNF